MLLKPELTHRTEVQWQLVCHGASHALGLRALVLAARLKL